MFYSSSKKTINMKVKKVLDQTSQKVGRSFKTTKSRKKTNTIIRRLHKS